MTDKTKKRDKAERRQQYAKAAARVRDTSFDIAWTFPIVLAAVALIISLAMAYAIGLRAATLGEPIAARVSWGMAAMLFALFFVFTLVACHTVMFKCGEPGNAVIASLITTVAGVVWTGVSVSQWRNPYVGPAAMQAFLDASVFQYGAVKIATALFHGLAVWAALVVVATSALLIASEIDPRDDDAQEQLSRQFRQTKILTYCAAALLVTGVFVIAALHQWPAHELTLTPEEKTSLERTGAAISTGAGTIATLVLASAYLPLIMVLRQRAYRVVRPWERTETWLAVHGFALQPTQQLAKLLLILSPLIAGGPISYLITLLSEMG